MRKYFSMQFLRANWIWLVGLVVALLSLGYTFKLATGKKPVRRKRRKKASVANRPLSKAPSRIRTKSGKLITGKANVQAYMKRIKALKKANAKRRK